MKAIKDTCMFCSWSDRISTILEVIKKWEMRCFRLHCLQHFLTWTSFQLINANRSDYKALFKIVLRTQTHNTPRLRKRQTLNIFIIGKLFRDILIYKTMYAWWIVVEWIFMCSCKQLFKYSLKVHIFIKFQLHY